MIRVVSVALVLVVAGLTGSASAECAWVEWLTAYRFQGGKVASETVQPFAAYTTRAECERARGVDIANEAERRKRDPSKGHDFECFPDTIDPRGPKAR